MNVVFDTKPVSDYDDSIAERYHFPSRYLELAEAAVGDWAVFRRPRADGGSKEYVAIARVDRVEPDPMRRSHHYAYVSAFLEFPKPAPWWDGRYAERSLRALPRQQVGVYMRGRSVRALDSDDFVAIVSAGMGSLLPSADEVENPIADPPFERRLQAALVTRLLRDACFRVSVCEAYDGRCAISGLRVSDDCGRFEAQAAHIWPVSEGGPDIVQNGLALSATLHWMFDRHLVSVAPDFSILVSPLVDVAIADRLISADRKLLLPRDLSRRPSDAYLARHRVKFLGALSH